jgi:hypothetical protein
MVTNLAIGVHGKKGTKMTSPIDFMPDWSGDREAEVKKQNVEDMAKMLKEIFANSKRPKKIEVPSQIVERRKRSKTEKK